MSLFLRDETSQTPGWGGARINNPLALLLFGILPALTCLGIRHWQASAATLSLELSCLWYLRAPWRVIRGRFALILLGSASLAWSTWLLGGHDLGEASSASLRIAAMVAPGMLTAMHIEPFALGDALIQQLHLPPRPVLAIIAALQRIEMLADDWVELGVIRRARGLGGAGWATRVREFSGRTLALLVLAVRSAVDVSAAMEVRGMMAWSTLGVRRGTLVRARWAPRDTLLVLIALLLAATPLAVGAALG